MKFTVATLVLASVAYSQTIASETAMLPSCSLTCLSNAITGAGCDISDNACQCGAKKNAITQAATPCIIGACSTDDALKVQGITSEICKLVAAGSSGGSSAAASATSASSMASSSVISMSSMASSAVSSVASSASSQASSAASGASSMASSMASQASSALGSATSAASSAVATQTTNAGSRAEAAGVVGAAAMLVAFAL